MLGRRFLDFILSPDEIALHRIILGEVTRFPLLARCSGAPDPNATAQIEAFLGRAAASGILSFPDTRLAAEQFISLVRGEIQLRQLLRLEADGCHPGISEVVENAVDTFIRAFGSRHL